MKMKNSNNSLENMNIFWKQVQVNSILSKTLKKMFIYLLFAKMIQLNKLHLKKIKFCDLLIISFYLDPH